MFFYAIIIAILIGYGLKGKLKNINNIELDWLYLVFIGFFIDITMQLLGRYGILKIGIATYIIDVIMYILIFTFVYKNKRDFSVILIGIGAMLNAIPIFSNGGTMPVSKHIMDSLIKNYTPTNDGLYSVMTNGSNFKILCDRMYIKIMGPGIFSIGDIVIAIGMMLIIILGMTSGNSKGLYKNQVEKIL